MNAPNLQDAINSAQAWVEATSADVDTCRGTYIQAIKGKALDSVVGLQPLRAALITALDLHTRAQDLLKKATSALRADEAD
jgi:hypothetical protein